MNVPSGFFGTESEVNTFVRPLVALLRSGGVLCGESFGGLVELAGLSGFIIIEGQGALPKGERDFRASVLPGRVLAALGVEGVRKLAAQLLRLEWGGLMLLGLESMVAVREPWFPGALVEWAYAHFDELVEVESRIASEAGAGRCLWLPPTNLHRALGFFGVESSRLYRPTRDEFKGLLVQAMDTPRWLERPPLPAV